MNDKRARLIIGPQSKPSLQLHARMRHDAARSRWIILAPERVFEPDAIAVAVLQLCDGSRTVDDIAVELGGSYLAEKSEILADIMPLLQDLADKGLLRT